MIRRILSGICVALAVAFIVILAQPATTVAQEVSVIPTASYMWGGSAQAINGRIDLGNGLGYGAIIDVAQSQNVHFQISWASFPATATFSPDYPNGATSELVGLNEKINVHYFQVGGIHQVKKGKAEPFAGMLLGAVLFHPEDMKVSGISVEDVWRFAMTFVGGINFPMSEKVGLRLQGRLFLPIYFSGAYVGVGTGGASVGATGGIPIVQGDIGLGLCIKIK